MLIWVGVSCHAQLLLFLKVGLILKCSLHGTSIEFCYVKYGFLFKLATSQPLVSELLFYMFESAKGPSFNLLTKTIGNMATPEFDFATDLKYGNSFKIS